MIVNHKKVAAIMQKEKIISKSSRKYKATTNSRHSLPLADNILNRDFTSARPNMKMVSDITYIPTDEGWLYIAFRQRQSILFHRLSELRSCQ